MPAENTPARRQAERILALAEQAAPELQGPAQADWLDRLEQEYAQVQQALEWSCAPADPAEGRITIGLRIAAALKHFWENHDHLTAGRDALAHLLAAAEATAPLPPAIVAGALDTAARLAYKQGDLAAADLLYHKSLAQHRDLGNTPGIALALGGLGNLARMNQDLAEAGTYYEEALALRRAAGDQMGIASTLYLLGKVAGGQGDLEAAARRFSESLALCREIGDDEGVGYALEALGLLAFTRGNYPQAVEHTAAAAAVYREHSTKANLADALDALGWLTAHTGDYGRAAALLEEAVALAESGEGRSPDSAWPLCHLGIVAGHQGDAARAYALLADCLEVLRTTEAPAPAQVGMCLLGFAALAGPGQPARMARLTAAAEALYANADPIDRAFAQAEFARLQAAVRTQLDESAQAAGRALTVEQAMAYALETT
jgi:tetratricopeptide (TPR) repeat protein